MLVESRPPAATPLGDLNVADSLRLRRQHGRATYLVALVAGRRRKRQTAGQARAGRINARTLPS
jgi:hypothetical protein